MFGSRKPGGDDYDAKLRPKDSVEMQQRVLAFMECKERWHMLKQRARVKLGTSTALSALEPVVSSTSEWSEEARSRQLERDDAEGFQLASTSLPIPQQSRASTDPMNDVQGHIPVENDVLGMSIPQLGGDRMNFPSPGEAVGDCLNELFFSYPDHGFAEQPMTSFDNSSFNLFSSFDYETSPTSPREQKRARNREAQRQRRTYCLRLDFVTVILMSIACREKDQAVISI